MEQEYFNPWFLKQNLWFYEQCGDCWIHLFCFTWALKCLLTHSRSIFERRCRHYGDSCLRNGCTNAERRVPTGSWCFVSLSTGTGHPVPHLLVDHHLSTPAYVVWAGAQPSWGRGGQGLWVLPSISRGAHGRWWLWGCRMSVGHLCQAAKGHQ